MIVDLVIEDPRWEECGLEGIAERAAASVGARLMPDIAAELVVLACDDARIAALNADFRGKPRPTNVLSWPAEERAAATPGAMPRLPVADAGPGPVELGDIAISFDTCKAEADAAGIAFADHVAHLTVHALLHLLGFDHETEEDAALMERLEVEILASQGISDPYSIG